MSIATDMQNLGEEIIASYDMRIKAIGELVKDTHQMLKGFHTEHKQMSATLRAELAKGEQDRLKDFKAMMSDIEKFLADVTKDVGNMVKGFQKEHKGMADELNASLEKGETERRKDFKNMMANIRRAIKEIETFVANKLKEFDNAHADMSEEMRKDLRNYVMGIVKETRRFLKECGSDMAQAKKAWKAMSATLAKARKGGVIPRIEAGEDVSTVQEAISKGKNRPAKKSKGSRQRVPVGV